MDNDKYIGRLLDGRYEIKECIGVGGMAVVYKALDHRLNRYVAVKLLKDEMAVDEDFRRRFHTESQAVAMLSHANIVAVYDVSRSSDMEYIVMELIEGITLKQYMQKRGALSWKETLHFATQITKALAHAHSRGIIHRDIKPHNIMILRDSSVKVADFGIARVASTQNTLTRETLGSVHYISPEQAKGGHVDERTDIYSLGVVMYEMLTGRLPFEGDSAVSVAIQHISSIPLSPREINPDIPVGLENITMRAMNPDLDKRYKSADELLADLEKFRKEPSTEFEYNELSFVAPGLEPEPEPDPKPARASTLPKASRMGEMDAEDYAASSRRARRVATLTGIFCVIVFIIILLLFLKSYLFNDMFTPAEDIRVPRFIGLKYEEVLLNPTYTDYFRFEPTYRASDDVAEGYIISQKPDEGDLVKKNEDKYRVKVEVSTGSNVVVLDDLTNKYYKQVVIDLQKLDLVCEITSVVSDTVTADYIVSTMPAAGETLYPGDTVFLTVSAGPEIRYVTMPWLVGTTRQYAERVIDGL
ncbi:MAG: Stk1 family PASTA domain-containing Ser/Thr kinase, partial [Oscillospiraceae bacterium]|nr:Stk1 family PASTA domain-containing Ser/Thr kinase [Oscillospiraceae bacterium]